MPPTVPTAPTVRPKRDWLSQLLEIVRVSGQMEIRCVYGAPWRNAYEQTAATEIPYHVVLKGTALLEDPQTRTSRELGAGDIVLLPHGSAHVLRDRSGRPPSPARLKEGANFTVSENSGAGERLDMLCGRFFVAPPHDRLIRDYLPATLVVCAREAKGENASSSAAEQLAALVQSMRLEAVGERLGGHAMLNTLSSALFTLTLRVASESRQAPTGLLALAGHPRLAPAISAMFNDPARAWTLPELAQLCSMSRATFMRHFEEALGRTAHDLLTDIRMSLAANALKNPRATTESVAELVGYQSLAAFRRSFAQWMGITPGEWRRTSREAIATAAEPVASA